MRDVVGLGIAGALVAALFLAIARVLGVDMNIEATLGIIAGASSGTGAELTGMLLLIGLGSLCGVVYAVLFEDLFDHAGAISGVTLAIPHAMISCFVLALIPLLSRLTHGWVIPSIPEPTAPSTAVAMVAFFVLHVLFGAIVGAGYQHTIVRATA